MLYLSLSKIFFYKINKIYLSKMNSDLTKYINALNYTMKSMSYWTNILTIPIGIILNMFAIYIYSRPNLNKSKSNMGFFYINLSFWSVTALVTSLFVISSKNLLNYDLSVLSHTSCAVIWFIRRFIRETPSWVDVLITIDRYLLICHNHKFNLMTKRKNLIIILFLIIFILISKSITNMYYSLSYTYVTTSVYDMNLNFTVNKTTVSSIVCSSSKYNALISDIISAVFKSILPSLIMISLSTLLVRKVREKKNNAKKLAKRSTIKNITSFGPKNVPSNKNFTHISKETSFTLCIVSMNTLFFVLNTPFSIMSIYRTIYVNYIVDQNPLQLSIVKNVYTLTYDLSNLYYSFMFFSYLCFNKLFLKETLYLFGRIKVGNLGSTS